MNQRTAFLIVFFALLAATSAFALFWPTDILPNLSPYAKVLLPAIGAAIMAALIFYERLLKIVTSLRDLSSPRRPGSPPPLTAITTDRLFDDLTDDGQVLWLDRGIVTPDDLRSGRDWLILTGPFKTGKSREAVQLIERVQAQGWVARDRIFELHHTFTQRTPTELRAALADCLDRRRPALVFVDDLPRYHRGDGLKLLDMLLDTLEDCPHGYFVATARDDELTDEHRAWLNNRSQPIREVALPAWQPQHLLDLTGRAASRSHVDLLPGAEGEFQAVTAGAPEVIIQAMQQLGARAAPVDAFTARQWASKTIIDLWRELLIRLLRPVRCSQYLFAALAAFRYARVSPHTSLVLHYAANLWHQGRWWARPWFAHRLLRQALPRLRHYSVEDSGGLIRCDDAPLEGLSTPDQACIALQAFLTGHRRLFHNRLLRRFYRDARPHVWALSDLAVTFFQQARNAEVGRLVTAALSLGAGPRLYVGRGLARDKEGDRAGAMADYNRAIELDPNYALAYHNRGNVRAKEGDLAGAMADYTLAIELDSNLAVSYHNRGLARAEEGDRAGAMADYNRAIELDPTLAPAYHYRGLARAEEGDLAGAIADYTRAIELDPTLAPAYHGRGTARAEEGDQAGAIADYSRAIELDPTLALAYYNRGVARSKEGDRAGAIADYTRAIELDPTLAVAYNNRGFARAEEGDLAGAIADYTRAIELDPNDALAYENRGAARVEEGDLAGAIADYSRAIELDPDDADTYYSIACTYALMADSDEVCHWLAKAIEIDPDWRDSARTDSDFDSIRDAPCFQALIA
jgi:tetratricopeptide (TPR) repeat protein